MAQSLGHHNFATIYRRVMRFQQNVLKEIVYMIKASVRIRQLNILCFAASKTIITSLRQVRDRNRVHIEAYYLELKETLLVLSTTKKKTDDSRFCVRQKIEGVDHLRQVLNSCWDVIDQELIDGAIEQWSK